jgi:Kdo2-lipid IVA lauroyltransferase/acyltransferase
VLQRFEYFAVRLILWPLSWLPVEAALLLSKLYLALVDQLISRWRKVAYQNLQLVGFKTDPGQLVDRLYGHLARLLITLPRLENLTTNQAHRWVEYVGLEHYQQAKAHGRGVLIATAHLGNWELSVVAHALLTEPMHIVVRPLDNPFLDQWFTRIRSSGRNHVHPRRQATRALLQALKNNQPVGILIDQNVASSEAIFISFMERPASAQPAFARLAAHTGAKVLLGFAIWNQAKFKYQIHFRPIRGLTGDITADTQRIHSELENAVREFPDQWLWFHRRWKNQPKTEKS